jgi:LPXTG-motif cell wall-anchored protein
LRLSRRLLLLLVAAVLAVAAPPAGTAFAQTTPGSTTELDPLSQTPQVPAGEDDSAGSGDSSSGSGSGSGSSSAAQTARNLPNTGSDARVLGLAGLALLLVGLGLRLRTTPERF